MRPRRVLWQCPSSVHGRRRLPDGLHPVLSLRCYNVAPPATPAGPTSTKTTTAAESSHDDNRNGPESPPSSLGARTASTPQPPPELRFFTHFAESDEDLHWSLLLEAHRKHGVWLSVPPQAPPTIPHVGPPAIPLVILPAAQQARMASMELAYPPTHDPPPLRTTGNRALQVELTAGEEGMATAGRGAVLGGSLTALRRQRLQELPEQERKLMVQVHEAAAAGTAHSFFSVSQPLSTSSQAATSRSTGPAGGAAAAPTIETVVKRTPADATMRFHCSLCGKAFRKRLNAVAHVDTIHNQPRAGSAAAGGLGEAVARVVDGPGPGEALGTEDIVVFSSPSTAATNRPTAVPPSPSAPSSPSSPTRPPAPLASARGTTNSRDSADATLADDKNAASPAASSKGSSGPLSLSPVKHYATAVVTLPEDALVDKLLQDVWDTVALGRDDIAKPANLPIDPLNPKRVLSGAAVASVTSTTTDVDGTQHAATASALASAAGGRAGLPPRRQHPHQQQPPTWDSCGGKFFIPAALVVEGQADRRKELEALQASKPLARATPEGAAPGIKRRANSISPTAGGGPSVLGGLTGSSAAAVRRGLAHVGAGSVVVPIRELNKQYPNPFGPTANSAMMESREKEPVNPFIDEDGESNGTSSSSSGAAGERRAIPSPARESATGLAESHASSSSTSAGGSTTDEDGMEQRRRRETALLAALVERPFACPLCRAAPPSPCRDTIENATASRAPAEIFEVTAGGGARFRLLDGLLDHVEDAHAALGGLDALSEETMGHLYDIESNPLRAARRELESLLSQLHGSGGETGDGADGGGGATGAAGAAGAGDGNGGGGGGGGDKRHHTTSNPAGSHSASATQPSDAVEAGDDESECPIPSVPPERVHVHARTAVNTVLVGIVRDIQEGFLRDVPVLQYVVAIRSPCFPRRAPAAATDLLERSASKDIVADSDGSPNSAGHCAAVVGGVEAAASRLPEQQPRRDEVREEEEEEEEELIVVRCVGSSSAGGAGGVAGTDDGIPRHLLRQRVHLGSRIFVEGSLRMNRHVDAVSKRSHAYPFVQVTPPMGSIQPL